MPAGHLLSLVTTHPPAPLEGGGEGEADATSTLFIFLPAIECKVLLVRASLVSRAVGLPDWSVRIRKLTMTEPDLIPMIVTRDFSILHICATSEIKRDLKSLRALLFSGMAPMLMSRVIVAVTCGGPGGGPGGDEPWH